MKPAHESLDILKQGAAQIVSETELLKKLERGKPLRVKLGVDPTAPDIHLGHTIPFVKLKQFQDLGHQVVLIIGDFTAMIGDPSGRSKTRPPLTHEAVLENAATYTDQAFKVLDRDRTEVVYNGDWFQKMGFAQILQLNSQVTLQQVLQREDFKNRIERSEEIRLHEIQYPIMQGWDSVEVRADVELGGTDQLFNLLVGRDLQKEEGQPPQVVMTMPLLEGTDGVKKMSKSYGNYVGVSEPPSEMFGKLMSISDDLMDRYYLLLLGEARDRSQHPMEAKKELAARITSRFHSQREGVAAREDWENRFSRKDLAAADLPALPAASFPVGLTVLQLAALGFEAGFGLKKSNSELKKQFIATGAVQLNGEKLSDPNANIQPRAGDVLRLSKTHSVRVS